MAGLPGGALVAVLVHSASKWSEGIYPAGEFFPLHILSALAPFYAIALVHYLDNWAAEAVGDFRPALSVGEADYEKLRYQLTTLSVRQLRMVSRIYTTHTHIDLFQLEPLYSFSSLSARTAIALGAMSYAWALLLIGLGGSQAGWAGLIETGAFTVVILTIFIWPLLGIHRLLQKEKKRLKASNAWQIKGVITELHRRRESGEYADMVGINEAMESLLKEQSVVDKIPTWPWQPETLRGVGTAILLPIFVWLITRVLERFVAF